MERTPWGRTGWIDSLDNMEPGAGHAIQAQSGFSRYPPRRGEYSLNLIELWARQASPVTRVSRAAAACTRALLVVGASQASRPKTLANLSRWVRPEVSDPQPIDLPMTWPPRPEELSCYSADEGHHQDIGGEDRSGIPAVLDAIMNIPHPETTEGARGLIGSTTIPARKSVSLIRRRGREG